MGSDEYVHSTVEQGGFILKVIQDDDPVRPRDEFDHLGKVVCWHRNYILGDEHPQVPGDIWASQLAEDLDPTVEDRIDYWEDGPGWRSLKNKYLSNQDKAVEVAADRVRSIIAKTLEKHTIMLPLFLMDHSGLSMSTSSGHFRACDSAGWDWGQVGWVYVTRADVLKKYHANRLTKKLREKVIDVLKAEIEEYDDYLTGNVWGFIIKDPNGTTVDSCWGFFGDPCYCYSEGKLELDYHIKKYNAETEDLRLQEAAGEVVMA